MIATRYHDFSAGHRVVGHESKCAFLHGHNYRVHFNVRADFLDRVGRVIDFSVIKDTLCRWLEDNWDHKLLLWRDDTAAKNLFNGLRHADAEELMADSVVWVPFNPTAENMALYLRREIGVRVLPAFITLASVVVEETRKCGVTSSETDDA